MFREGQYLEVIKTADGSLTTAIVTIKEKTVEYKNRAIKTNKWLDLQDWVSLYGILRKAILRNNENRSNGKTETTERRKSARNLEVTYKFEATESPEDRKSMPTIRATVKPARKSSPIPSGESKKISTAVELEKTGQKTNEKAKKKFKSRDKVGSENYSLEEYVPSFPSSTKINGNLKYVPSRKSALLRMRCNSDENTYTPTSGGEKSPEKRNDSQTQMNYIPNSLKSLTKIVHETYDPCAASILSADLRDAYIPSSKGTRIAIEEYQPGFASKSMKFDDSYVPSSTNLKSPKQESRKRSRKSLDSKHRKSTNNRSSNLETSKYQL